MCRSREEKRPKERVQLSVVRHINAHEVSAEIKAHRPRRRASQNDAAQDRACADRRRVVLRPDVQRWCE